MKKRIRKISMLFYLFVLLLAAWPCAAQDVETYTHGLTQSTAQYQFWTTPPSERVFKDDAVPTDLGSENNTSNFTL